MNKTRTSPGASIPQGKRLTVSLQTLAKLMDAHRTTVRRWLKEAGVRPVAIGQGRNGGIRYRWEDVQAWLDSLEYVD